MKLRAWPTLTLEEEHEIRRALMVGLNGWEYTPAIGDECQEKGKYPFYPTVRMAEKAMQELLKLKAEVAKYRAEEARRYAEMFAEDEDGEIPFDGKVVLGKAEANYE